MENGNCEFFFKFVGLSKLLVEKKIIFIMTLKFYPLPLPLTSQNFGFGLCFVCAHPRPLL